MNIDPFEMMKNLQEAQARMGEMQEKLRQLRATGGAGGDLVTVEMNGLMEVTAVHIDPIAVDPRDVKMLEELMQAAYVAAAAKVREEIGREFGAAGLGGLPGMFGGTG